MLTAVIGTGTWGTAAAVMLHRCLPGAAVLLGRDPVKVAAMSATRLHPQLGDLSIPADLIITANAAVLSGVDLVLWAVPTQHTRAMAKQLAAWIPAGVPVVSLAKGLEEHTLATVTTVLAEELGARAYATLTGPSHAAEVVAGMPTGLLVAGPVAVGRLVQERLHSRGSRIYTGTDLIGAELGGALKNVIAVAAGIVDGLALGDNLKAVIMTRGLAEMRRLGRAMGAQDATFAGLAGMGDLLTTAYSPHGRNRALGLAIANNQSPLIYLRRQTTVAEGAWTSRAAVALGHRHQVELPIAAQVASVIWDGNPVRSAMESLLARAPKEEDT